MTTLYYITVIVLNIIAIAVLIKLFISLSKYRLNLFYRTICYILVLFVHFITFSTLLPLAILSKPVMYVFDKTATQNKDEFNYIQSRFRSEETAYPFPRDHGITGIDVIVTSIDPAKDSKNCTAYKLAYDVSLIEVGLFFFPHNKKNFTCSEL
jgi:hypothetical protein